MQASDGEANRGIIKCNVGSLAGDAAALFWPSRKERKEREENKRKTSKDEEEKG